MPLSLISLMHDMAQLLQNSIHKLVLCTSTNTQINQYFTALIMRYKIAQ